jgi:hypothetical protein
MALGDFEEIKNIGTLVALTASERRWHMLDDSSKNNGPLGYHFFTLVVIRYSLYVNSLRRQGTQWLGLRFHYLPIWCSNS